MTPEKPATGRAARAQDARSVARREALDAWQKSLSASVVEEIIRYRDKTGLSNDELRKRLSSLGWTLTKDSLASILASKRKSMPLGDIFLFAGALNVPPVALMFPIAINQATPLWPGDENPYPAIDAARWVSGDFGWVPPPVHSEDAIDNYYDAADVMRQLDKVDELATKVMNVHNALEDLGDGDETRRGLLLNQLPALITEWASTRQFLRQANRGIVLPDPFPPFAFVDSRPLEIPELPIPGVSSAWVEYLMTRLQDDAAPTDSGK